jgi:cytochrome oxidase Cu insertion factor (SCO1/SenC/PrrC family)
MFKMHPRRKFAALAVATICLAAGLGFLTAHQRESRLDQRDFVLSDTNGHEINLAAFHGKWALLFFGFTNCPDVCPTALLNISNTLKAMGPAADALQPVFVTIDPERDTPSVLKDYLANFDPRIIGLTGTPAQIAAMAKLYQVYYRKQPLSDGSYSMDHSTAFELISPDGVYIRAFRPDDDPGDFAAELSAAMGVSR